jgi:hypothetical protein
VANRILLNNGTDKILLNDGVSFLLLNDDPTRAPGLHQIMFGLVHPTKLASCIHAIPAGILASAAGAAVFELEYLNTVISTTNATTYNFTSEATGDADATRINIAAVGVNGAETVASSSINSETGTTQGAAAGGGYNAAFVTAANPSGTTGTYSVTFTDEVANCAIHTFRMVNAASETATATASDATNTANALAASLTIDAGGAGIGFVFAQGDGAVRTWTWTNMTENAGSDQTVEGEASTASSINTSAGAATRTATANDVLDATNTILILGAWA